MLKARQVVVVLSYPAVHSKESYKAVRRTLCVRLVVSGLRTVGYTYFIGNMDIMYSDLLWALDVTNICAQVVLSVYVTLCVSIISSSTSRWVVKVTIEYVSFVHLVIEFRQSESLLECFDLDSSWQRRHR